MGKSPIEEEWKVIDDDRGEEEIKKN